MQPNAKRSRVGVKYEGITKVLERLFVVSRSHITCERGTYDLPAFSRHPTTGVFVPVPINVLPCVTISALDPGATLSYVTSYSPNKAYQFAVFSGQKNMDLPDNTMFFEEKVRLKGGCFLVQQRNQKPDYSDIRLVNETPAKTATAATPQASGKKKGKGNTTKFSGSLNLRVIVKKDDKWIATNIVLRTKAVPKVSGTPNAAFPGKPLIGAQPPLISPFPSVTPIMDSLPHPPPMVNTTLVPQNTGPVSSQPLPPVPAFPYSLLEGEEQAKDQWEFIEYTTDVDRSQAEQILREAALADQSKDGASFMLLRGSKTEATLQTLTINECTLGPNGEKIHSIYHHRIGYRDATSDVWVGTATLKKVAPNSEPWIGYYLVKEEYPTYHRTELVDLIIEVVWKKIRNPKFLYRKPPETEPPPQYIYAPLSSLTLQPHQFVPPPSSLESNTTQLSYPPLVSIPPVQFTNTLVPTSSPLYPSAHSNRD
ncbi:hypothetical protein Pelo_7689 [Pelomyxa schiedti]|nr:hypothetical protein Pelo_7689 [Pelomyxa schiedti]